MAGGREGVKFLGLQTKPKKILGPQFKPPKIPCRISEPYKISGGTTRPGYAGTITNLQIGLNTPKSPYLNQATQKNTCQNFPTRKKLEIENFK